jgi:hypothetical protein
MFQINFLGKMSSVRLNAGAGDEPAEMVWSGSPVLNDYLQRRLETSYGAFGHLLGEEPTPVDLHYAVMQNLEAYGPRVVRGAEMVEQYGAGVPVGAVT